MKYFVGFIAVLVAFISQNEATPAGDVSYLYLKSRDIRLSLQLYKTQMVDQENRKFQAVQEYYEKMVELTVNLTVDGIDGKNHENCVATLKTQLEAAETQLKTMTELCIRRGIPNWLMITLEINDLISMGEAFEKHVDKIGSTCSDHNAGIFEQCLKKYLPELTSSVDYYQNREEKLKLEVQVLTGLGFAQFGECLVAPKDDFTRILEAAEDEALQCISVVPL